MNHLLNLFFSQGSLTSPEAAQLLEEAIAGDQERLIDILLYRKDGMNMSNKNIMVSHLNHHECLPHFRQQFPVSPDGVPAEGAPGGEGLTHPAQLRQPGREEQEELRDMP